MNNRSLFLLLSACVLCLVLSGCSDGSVTSPAPPAGTPTPATQRVIQINGNLAFGNVPVSSTMKTTITISNAGNAVLTVSAIAIVGEGPTAAFHVGWSKGTILPNASQQITIQFQPGVAQVYSGSLVVLSDATSGLNTIPISGTGTTGASAPYHAATCAGSKCAFLEIAGS